MSGARDARRSKSARKSSTASLGRATGLDVDAMEERIERERAAEEAAAAARAERAERAAGPGPRVATDARWLAAAAALAERARPLSRPNPAVGAIIVKDGMVVGRGWTQPGGRPHAEAVALAQAGEAARGATLYVTLEPCAHASERGPACADIVVAGGSGAGGGGHRGPGSAAPPGRASPGCATPGSRSLLRRRALPRRPRRLCPVQDDRISRNHAQARDDRRRLHRPPGRHQPSGSPAKPARAHAHRERARADAILVGGGTLRADEPWLDVRLPGLEEPQPAAAAC